MGTPPQNRIIIIGAGMGGLAAALRLAGAGVPVLVLEAAKTPGGKLREVLAGGRAFDAGPTVLTMKWVFDDLLAAFNTCLEDEVALEKAEHLARHYWTGGLCLDLYADLDRSAEKIAATFSADDAAGFRRFAADSQRVFETLKNTFISAPKPNPLTLSKRIGFNRLGDMLALRPFTSLWKALGGYFCDPRLRQLFARYATYCGSSPFAAPATLMLVAHVEQAGVWIPSGGIHAIARRFQSLAQERGASFRFNARVEHIQTGEGGRKVTSVRLETGEVIAADQIIFNGDVSALPALLAPRDGAGQTRAHRISPGHASTGHASRFGHRSQSALVTCGLARAEGVPLAHHTVFFSDDYEAEFRAVFNECRAPADPTVYVCAQDRDGGGRMRPEGAGQPQERLYCLMNLPADGDRHPYATSELDRCLTAMDRRLAANGLRLQRDREAQVLTAPDGFNRLFPATGGALYGQASHGWMASFKRPGTHLGTYLGPGAGPKGLYLAGGSVHPGPGLPMAALSGRLAADQMLAELAMTGQSRPVAISGGMSTQQAAAGSSPSRSSPL